MTLEEKIERSKSKERINFDVIGCLEQDDPMVSLESSDRIIVEPVWTMHGDFEGGMYRDYIAKHPEYDKIYVRPELAKRLEIAARSLDERYKLVVQAGHRPVEVQVNTLNGCKDDYIIEHPEATEEEALEHARLFVSDPVVELPPHCCGAAVDIYLFDSLTNQPVDCGSPVNLDEEISYLYTDFITPEQQANRGILLKAMLDAGFASAAFEWWHFSYGDQVWAWFYREKDCLYGLVEV
jgi:zinc D-Ala-D-Ala dipeptidase